MSVPSCLQFSFSNPYFTAMYANIVIYFYMLTLCPMSILMMIIITKIFFALG